MSEAPTVHVVVVAVTVDPKRGVLLVRKRDDGMWGCPQGWMRPGESLRETAKRKVSEEAGVLVSAERMLATKSVLVSSEPAVGELQVLLRCHPLAGNPRPGICELDAQFTSLGELPELRDGQQEWLLEALSGELDPLE